VFQLINRNYIKIFLPLLIICLNGCTNILGIYYGTRLYQGNPLPREKVALFYCVKGCNITSVKDVQGNNEYPIANVSKLELHPGHYVISIRYIYGESYARGHIDYAIDCKPNHVYLIYPQLFGKSPERMFKPWVYDKNGNEDFVLGKMVYSEFDEGDIQEFNKGINKYFENTADRKVFLYNAEGKYWH